MQVQEQGWLAQHVLVYDDTTSELMGCVPLYLKTHSYGEYVFDHSWASTHSRCGIAYYPKLQSCVPFTPVTGNRLLIKPGIKAAAVTKALAKALLEITGRLMYNNPTSNCMPALRKVPRSLGPFHCVAVQ